MIHIYDENLFALDLHNCEPGTTTPEFHLGDTGLCPVQNLSPVTPNLPTKLTPLQ